MPLQRGAFRGAVNLVADDVGVAQASSPASSGGVSPPVPTRGETPRELAGETPAVPWRNRTLAGECPRPTPDPPPHVGGYKRAQVTRR